MNKDKFYLMLVRNLEYTCLTHDNTNEDTEGKNAHACYSELLKDKSKPLFIIWQRVPSMYQIYNIYTIYNNV